MTGESDSFAPWLEGRRSRVQGTPITSVFARLAEHFTDHRDPEAIEHTVKDLIGQRVYGLALGYEDLNDHDCLRLDPLRAVLVGKAEPTGQDRCFARDEGEVLASSGTLNRLELAALDADASARCKKIIADCGGMAPGLILA
jgi:hypothetical protein